MSYAFVQGIAASWNDYQQVAGGLGEPAPAGLILHAAGPTDEGVRIIAIWEDGTAWQRFGTARLAPAIEPLGGPARSQRTFRDLRPAHLVVGERGSREALHPQTREDDLDR